MTAILMAAERGAEVGAVIVARPCLTGPCSHEPAADDGGDEHLDHLSPGHRLSERLDEVIEALIFHGLALSAPEQKLDPLRIGFISRWETAGGDQVCSETCTFYLRCGSHVQTLPPATPIVPRILLCQTLGAPSTFLLMQDHR
jgi:hypothetical protein